jgi:hypothetical protein
VEGLNGDDSTIFDKTVTTVVYYEGIKRELQRRPKYECRCDERLITKSEGSTRLTYTGFLGPRGTGTPTDRDLPSINFISVQTDMLYETLLIVGLGEAKNSNKSVNRMILLQQNKKGESRASKFSR